MDQSWTNLSARRVFPCHILGFLIAAPQRPGHRLCGGREHRGRDRRPAEPVLARTSTDDSPASIAKAAARQAGAPPCQSSAARSSAGATGVPSARWGCRLGRRVASEPRCSRLSSSCWHWAPGPRQLSPRSSRPLTARLTPATRRRSRSRSQSPRELSTRRFSSARRPRQTHRAHS